MIPDCSVDWGSPLSKLKWVFGIVPKECETGAVASTIELGPGLLAKGASAVSRGAKIVEAIEETKVASQSAPGWRRLLGTVLKSEGEVARIEAQAAKVESLAAHDARLQLDAAEGAAAAAGRQSAARGIAREHRVAEMVGGQVSRRDVVVKGLGRTDIDVVGSAGEFIAVGGPSKAINLARLGRQMQILRAAADEAKVSAKAYFEVGTPEEALRIAKRHLGEGNVFLFEP